MENIINLILALVPFVVAYLALKAKTKKLIQQFVPDGIQFANKLNGDNTTKLKRAVSDVELQVLKHTPAVYRPLVDYFIDADYIVQLIERYITEEKRKQM